MKIKIDDIIEVINEMKLDTWADSDGALLTNSEAAGVRDHNALLSQVAEKITNIFKKGIKDA
jgi:hypothetical protein